jgi:hypothetical protein
MALAGGAAVLLLTCTGGVGIGLASGGRLTGGVCGVGGAGCGAACCWATDTISITGKTCGGVSGELWLGVIINKPRWAAPMMPSEP